MDATAYTLVAASISTVRSVSSGWQRSITLLSRRIRRDDLRHRRDARPGLPQPCAIQEAQSQRDQKGNLAESSALSLKAGNPTCAYMITEGWL